MNEVPFSSIIIAVPLVGYFLTIIVLNFYTIIFSFLRKNGLAIFTKENYFNISAPFVHPVITDSSIELNVFFQSVLSLNFNSLTGFLFFPKSKFSYTNKYVLNLKKGEWTFYPIKIFPILGLGIAAVSDNYDRILVISQLGNNFGNALRNNGYIIKAEDRTLNTKLKEHYFSKSRRYSPTWINDFKKELNLLQSLTS